MPVIPKGRLIFARRTRDGGTVGVHDVPNGKGCGCVCLECGGPLIARQGQYRAYFAHAGFVHHGCGPTAWHEALSSAFASLKEIDLGRRSPVYRLRGPQRVLQATKDPVLGGEFIPDALLQLQSGATVAVEVVVSHDVSGIKLAAMQQEGLHVLRIDAGILSDAIRRSPATASDLKRTVGSFGAWQSWPTIWNAPHQGVLDLRSRKWWRWLE